MTSSECWGYATDENAEGWTGMCATRDEAVAEAYVELALEGLDCFYVVRGRVPAPSEFLPGVDSTLEAMSEAASDECGEAASDFPDVGKDGRDELEALLSAWCLKWLTPVRFWVADGEPERIALSEQGREF